jgi:hypothetical protein
MIKYKDKFKVVKERDNQGKIVKDDNYLVGKYGQIYRFNENTLIAWIFTKSRKLIVPLRKFEEIKQLDVEIWNEFVDDESVEFRFHEEDLDQIAEVMKLRRKRKMDRDSEAYRALIERTKRCN